MKIDSQFEFRLEYPRNGLVYQWKQAANPLLINEGEHNSENYSPMYIPFDSRKWRGYLAKSTALNCTLLDGQSESTWWFSIGTVKCPSNIDTYFEYFPDTIPGPASLPVKEVILWIKIPFYPRMEEIQKIGVLVAILMLSS